MEQGRKFSDCKKRNEQQLLTIRKLESDIAKARKYVEDTRKLTLKSKEKNEHHKQLTRQQSKYQQKIAAANSKAVTPLPAPTNSKSGKRDLTKLLSSTPEMIRNKLEQHIQSQTASSQPLSTSDLYHIKQLITRLPDQYNKQQFDNLVLHLLSDLRKIKFNSHLYDSPIHYHIDTEKEHQILEFHSHRNAKVHELAKRREELELECAEAESKLIKRIRELHADPQVQSALTKSLRIKAANHQSQTELHSMRNQSEDLARDIQSIEGQSVSNIDSRIANMMDFVIKKQNQVQSSLVTNNSCRETLKSQRIQVKDDNRDRVDLFIQKIVAAKSIIVQDLANKSMQVAIVPASQQDHILDELLNAKNAMSPYSLISTLQLFNEINNKIHSINEYEKDSLVEICSDIRDTLESLVDKWGSSLDKLDIPIKTNVPEYHDGIDNVIQSIDAIRMHVEESERLYIVEEEQKLKSKLAITDKIEKEIHRTQESFNERKLITEIGNDFAVQDKSFPEWLSELEIKRR